MKEEDRSIESPPGYLYAGAHEFRARVRDLAPEPLPPAVGGVPIFTTGKSEITQIKLPFDCFIYEVYGSALPDLSTAQDANDLLAGMVFPTALEGRDLFTVDWDLDSHTSYSTDGRQRMMYPASVTVGTRLVPRPMAWMLKRNQRINVRFRSLLNAIVPSGSFVNLSECGITFAAVNMNDP